MKFAVVSVTYIENKANKIMFGNNNAKSYYEIRLDDDTYGNLVIKVPTLQDARKYKIGSSYEAKLTEIL